MRGVAYVVGTFDTKGSELDYVAGLVRTAGVEVRTVDLSTGAGARTAGTGADVLPRDVAAHHPDGPAAVFTGDRGTAVTAMARAFERWLTRRHHDGEVAGVLGLGGSGGTALIAPALRALPVGLPKLLASTVAGGDVSAYVGASDLVMSPSVTDVAGLNRISRVVLGNAAHALAGMIAHEVPASADKPALALTMFGVTTPCVTAVSAALADRYDPLVFHAVGTGGRAMEKLIDDGQLAGVLDITTTEVCDLVAGGVFSAGPERLDALSRVAVPYVGSCGALDMVNFGAPDTVPERYRDRLLYEHNPQVTLMRTTPAECRAIAGFLAGKLNAARGPVRLLLPVGGVSLLDAPGQPFHDPEADAVLFDTLEELVHRTDQHRVERLPHALNEPAFAQALVAAWDELATSPAAAAASR